jgi:ferredoxin
MSKHLVTLHPSLETVSVDENENLLEALKRKKVYIKSSCGGHASCSDCLIKIKDGAENLNEATFEEGQLLGNVFHITKERLACQTKITGDISIDISKHQLSKDQERIKKKDAEFAKSKIKVRKKEEKDKILQERQEKVLEKRASRDEKDQAWHKHWEREEDPLKPKRVGGGSRPKPFTTHHLDQDSNSTTTKNNEEKESDNSNNPVVDKERDFRKKRQKD